MIDWWIAPIILGAVAAIGLVAIIKGVLALDEKIELLVEFSSKFIDFSNNYFEKDHFDHKQYDWLLSNVDEVNGMLGSAGVIQYKPAFANYIHNNYQILLNTLPQFKAGEPHPHDISLIESILKRFTSVSKKYLKEQRRKLKNPFRWIIEGLEFVLSSPLLLLKEVGVISGGTFSTIKYSKIFKLIVGLLSALGIVETIVGLLTRKSVLGELLISFFR